MLGTYYLLTLPLKLILLALSLIDVVTEPVVCSITLSLKIIMNFLP